MKRILIFLFFLSICVVFVSCDSLFNFTTPTTSYSSESTTDVSSTTDLTTSDYTSSKPILSSTVITNSTSLPGTSTNYITTNTSTTTTSTNTTTTSTNTTTTSTNTTTTSTNTTTTSTNTTTTSTNTTTTITTQVTAYTLTFNSNGGSYIEPLIAYEGSNIIAPVVPVKEGYSFSGWYIDQELSTEFNFSVMPASNMVLYAKWDINTYHIHFVTNTDEVIQSIAILYDEEITLPDPIAPVYTSFIGWYLDIHFLNAFSYNTMPSNDLTVYAKWNYETFTISFDTNGGNAIGEIYVNKFTAKGELPSVTKEDYIFDGWFYDTNLSQPYSVEDIITNDIILYAKWTLDYGDLYNLNYIILNDVLADDLIISSIDANNSQVFVFGKNNELYGFGSNWLGQMGNGNKSDLTEPERLTEFIPLSIGEKILQVASGSTFTLALTSDNRLFGWGDDSHNQLTHIANNPYDNSFPLPVDISSSIDFYEGEKILIIRAGMYSAYVITSENRIFSWGLNQYGELGNGEMTTTGHPQDITAYFSFLSGEKLVDLQLGNQFAIAYTNYNRVFTWGSNFNGQLGNGSLVQSSLPVDITGAFGFRSLEKITAIGTGFNQSYLATSRGRVYGWGSNRYGQFGEPSDDKLTPFLLPTDIFGDYVVSISGGMYHMAMVTQRGRVFTAGLTEEGLLGDGGTYLNENTRNYIEITHNFNLDKNDKIIKVGTSKTNTYALSASGKIYGFGNSAAQNIPQYLDESLVYNIESYLELADGETIIKIEQGNSFNAKHYVLLTSNNRVFAWGTNSYGQLGYSLDNYELVPFEITNQLYYDFNEKIIDVAANSYSTSLVTETGKLILFGLNNSLGENGEPIRTSKLKPTDVTEYFNFGTYEVIIKVVMLEDRSYVLTNQNQLYAWGRNQFGYLGDGSSTDRLTPVNITAHFGFATDESIVDFQRTESDCFILTSKNRLFTFGSGYGYISGDGTNYVKRIPFDLSEYLGINVSETITALYTGYRHVIILTSENRVLAWGSNANSYLDLDTLEIIKTAKDLTSMFELDADEYIVEIAAGLNYNLALTSNHRVLSWGYNDDGVLAVGKLYTLVGTDVYDISDVFNLSVSDYIIDIFAENNSVIAVSNQGEVFSWGNNNYGQVGNGLASSVMLPTRIHIYEEEVYLTETHYKNDHIDLPNIISDEYQIQSWYYDKGFMSLKDSHMMDEKDINLYGFKEYDYTIEYYIPNILNVSAIYGSRNKEFFIITTDDNQVYTWGANSYGMLGTGSTFSEAFPVNITERFNFLDGEVIKKVDIGSNHVVVLTNYGRLFVWGDNSKSQLGFTKTTTAVYYNYETGGWIYNSPNYRFPNNITNEFPLEDNEFIANVEILGNSTYVTTSLGRTFVFGQVKITSTETMTYTSPTEIKDLFTMNEDETFYLICEGVDFNILLTNEGRVFTWGSNQKGQLGNGTTNESEIPIEITNLFNLDTDDRIVLISAGARNAIAVSEKNRVFVWGDNGLKEIPYTQDSYITSPIEITSYFNLDNDDSVINVASGGSHKMLLTDSGRVFTWGYNASGYLGIGNKETTNEIHELTMVFVALGEKVTDIDKANNYSMVVCESGSTYIWGSSTYDSLYLGAENKPIKPLQVFIQGYDIYQVETFSAGEEITILDLSTINGFSGWYMDSNLSTPFNLSLRDNYFIKAYSKFEIIVSFETNGGNSISSIVGIFGDEVKNLQIPTRSGYYFGGWYEDSELTVKAKYIQSSMTLYARWLQADEDDLIGTEGLWFQYTDEGYLVSNYEGSSIDVIVPRLYNDGYHGYDYVIGIAEFAFYNQELISLKLPDTITTLESYVFIGSEIKEVIFLGDAPVNVHEDAFYKSNVVIYHPETSLNWPTVYFYHTPVRIIGDYVLPLNPNFNDQIDLWNESTFIYADLMYLDPSINWVDLMETTDLNQRLELMALSNSIVEGLTTTEEKVQAIYYWVATNIIYSEESTDLNIYESYINRSGVCYQYANLINELLRAQNIPSLMVRGYYYVGYSDFTSLIESHTNDDNRRHAWNYVLIEGDWIILDATHMRYDISEADYNYSLWGLQVEDVMYYLPGMDMTFRDGLYFLNNNLYYIMDGIPRYYYFLEINHQGGGYSLYMSDPANSTIYEINRLEDTTFILGGWIENNGELYYAYDDGHLVFGQTVEIDGEYYTFDELGRLIIE